MTSLKVGDEVMFNVYTDEEGNKTLHPYGQTSEPCKITSDRCPNEFYIRLISNPDAGISVMQDTLLP